MFRTGMQTGSVCGSKLSDCRFRAPQALGTISRGQSAMRAIAVSIGRPLASCR